MKSYLLNSAIAFILVGILATTSPAVAQKDASQVQSTIDQLFTGMRSGDSSLVRNSFVANATLQTVAISADGSVKIQRSSVDGFAKAVGTPHTDVWDEQVYDLVIKVDGPMATVWAPYKFYRGDTFSHCGVNAFILIKDQNQWKIESITDTRRKEQCP